MEDDNEDDRSYGPCLPPHLRVQKDEAVKGVPDQSSDEDDEAELVGPLPPGQSFDALTPAQQEIELKLMKSAASMAQKALGQGGAGDDDGAKAAKREAWMLELPSDRLSSGTTFKAAFSNRPKVQLDSSWTKAPLADQRAKDSTVEAGDEEASEESNQKLDKDVLDYMADLKRDAEMGRIAEKLSNKRGSASLLELHEGEQKKKKQEQKLASSDSGSGSSARRPFDREIDLKVNQFDEAAKKAMLKKARQINDRFSSGQQKFL